MHAVKVAADLGYLVTLVESTALDSGLTLGFTGCYEIILSQAD